MLPFPLDSPGSRRSARARPASSGSTSMSSGERRRTRVFWSMRPIRRSCGSLFAMRKRFPHTQYREPPL